MIEHANILYLPSFNIIGGTEQFIFEVAKKYHKYDIAVVTRGGDPKQLARLRKYVPVYKITVKDRIKCTFEMNEGNHFKDAPYRLYKGIRYILSI